MNELLILVDENDRELGVSDKLSVHQNGSLHRAFSVFIFNSKGELLLQQRADEKYHSPGLWTNTCCSHPIKGEEIEDTIKRRLQEEMGMQCKTEFQFTFIYKAEFDNGLTEHELDHVYVGFSDDLPAPNSLEVKNCRYINLHLLKQEIALNPQDFSAWLKICLPKVIEHFNPKISGKK
ncbi:MAG TPA: isopentenyl-diphosphate Delta-isomerase [Daejeonella sp.]|nr:isopentenyl-diphosphate Delta-isomerase [Daejeonella sp.]